MLLNDRRPPILFVRAHKLRLGAMQTPLLLLMGWSRSNSYLSNQNLLEDLPSYVYSAISTIVIPSMIIRPLHLLDENTW